MDNWFEHRDGIVKKQYQNCLPKQISNYLNCDNSILNQNNRISKMSRWDCSSQVTHIGQSKCYNKLELFYYLI